MPGMIDAGDRLGLVEIPAEQITVDATEYTDPIHSDLRVLDALNPRSELIRVARGEGITNALSEPAEGNLIAGQSAFINLDGETVEQLVVKSPAALHINGRTETDFRRWTDYVASRKEITHLAYEFTTGTAWAGRREQHAAWLCEAAMYYACGRALGLDLSPAAYLLVVVVATMAVSVPITQAGLGVFELAITGLLIAFRVDKAQAAAFSIFAHVMVALPYFMSGPLVAFALKLNLSDIVFLRAGRDTEVDSPAGATSAGG